MIDSDLLPADTHGTHAATVAGQRVHRLPGMQAERWRGPQPLQQLVAEPLAIGDLVTWRVDAALQCGAQWRQCRFDLHTLSRIQQPLTGPLIQRLSTFGEACPITVDHQFAVGAPGETVQSVLLAPAAQNLLAVQGQAQQMSGVAAVDRAPAGRQEAQAPAPLPQARPRTEAQGAVCPRSIQPSACSGTPASARARRSDSSAGRRSRSWFPDPRRHAVRSARPSALGAPENKRWPAR